MLCCLASICQITSLQVNKEKLLTNNFLLFKCVDVYVVEKVGRNRNRKSSLLFDI